MLIATSLMYSKDNWEIEKQKKAMCTWKEIGFRVISCNVPEEIEILRDVFPEVSFVELKRSGKEKTGKPFPFIYDMLQALKDNTKEEKELCGIVNSDIFLKNILEDEIRKYFTLSDNRVLIMHRYDIDDEYDTKGEYYFSGIDAFFFQRNYITVFPDKGFMLGRPEWDHWFLYEADKAGMQILEIKNKIAFHIKHKQRWTASDSNHMVVSKNKTTDSVSFDEEYYFATNILMSDLSKRVMLGTSTSEESMAVVKEDGLYFDIDRGKLLDWEKEKYSEKNEVESLGILYFKKDKAYRVCALHREAFLEKNQTFSLGNIFENDKEKGNILRYIDFKDLDFANSLGRVYVYPAGRAARLLIDCLDTYGISVLGMVDRDSALWGKEYKGKRIYDLSVLDEQETYDHVLIASNLYVREIYEELSKKVAREKLVVL